MSNSWHLPGRKGMPIIVGLATTTAVAGVATAVAVSRPSGSVTRPVAATDTFTASAAPALAPAQAGAAKGGRVIVVLRNQHKDINLVKQSKQRVAASLREQKPLIASIQAHGGSHVTQLISVNAVAAKLPAAEVGRLQHNPAVAKIVPDLEVPMDTSGASASAAAPAAKAAATDSVSCPTSSVIHPGAAQEPESDADVHASTGDPGSPDMANSIATGKGVIVAIRSMNSLAGNPNFQRADGSHVVLDAPSYTADNSNDEAYLDGSAVAAQGTATYSYAGALPQSSVDPNCQFYIEGLAPDASLVDESEITIPLNSLDEGLLNDNNTEDDSAHESESQLIKGIDNVTALGPVKADVASESFGNSNFVPQIVYAANDAAVAAGVPVVVSSGDSGVSGTMNPMASDPNVISAGAVDNNRLIAMNDGFPTYESNQIAALSSSGVSVNDRLVDLVSPGWFGEVACHPNTGGCPNYPTEAGRGTSMSAPTIAGAIADIIQAYRDSHDGATPTPEQDKELLTSTATDLDAPSAEQGAGLMNVYAAVKAAQQLPGTTVTDGPGDAPGLVASPSQLDLVGRPGTTVGSSVSLFNTSDQTTTVHAAYRTLTDPEQIGSTVTQDVTAPDPTTTPKPPAGYTAADPITFTVPAGLGRVLLDMIWPDATNDNNLYVQLFNPQGEFVQESYDDGPARTGRTGSVPNNQFIDVTDPEPGRWTAKILWGGLDTDLAVAQINPGAYRGPVSVGVWGQRWTTTPAGDPVTIPAHASASVPLSVTMPGDPGDWPESVQFTGDNGGKMSYAITRRSLIPTGFDIPFQTLITSTVGRTIGQINQYNLDVPAGSAGVSVHFTTPDASADNPFTFYLVDPTGKVAQSATTPTTVNGQAVADRTLTVSNPAAGRWQVDVKLNLTTSGQEFTQTVSGTATVVPTTTVSGTVPATLALSLGDPATFGSFVPGVASDYTATTSADVVSSAGDGTLSVSDPSATAPGHLVNGSFTLPQALQADAASPRGTGGAFAPVGGADSPTGVLTYAGPVAHDPVTVNFKQSIGANDALRTGTYAKTLTFTLSTTTP